MYRALLKHGLHMGGGSVCEAAIQPGTPNLKALCRIEARKKSFITEPAVSEYHTVDKIRTRLTAC